MRVNSCISYNCDLICPTKRLGIGDDDCENISLGEEALALTVCDDRLIIISFMFKKTIFYKLDESFYNLSLSINPFNWNFLGL